MSPETTSPNEPYHAEKDQRNKTVARRRSKPKEPKHYTVTEKDSSDLNEKKAPRRSLKNTYRLPLEILDPQTGDPILVKERAKSNDVAVSRSNNNKYHESRSRFSTPFLTPNGQKILFCYTARNIPSTPEKGVITQL